MKQHTWHIFISGWNQDGSTMHGVQVLWLKIRKKLVDADTFVLLRTWKNDWDVLAQKIKIVSGTDACVNVYGYSWGGASAVRFARELGSRGLTVQQMVLCDPVYRSPTVCGYWRSMLNKFMAPKITIPANVQRVRWMRQRLNKPQGHDLVAEDAKMTAIDMPKICKVEHSDMDELPTFAKLVNAAIKE